MNKTTILAAACTAITLAGCGGMTPMASAPMAPTTPVFNQAALPDAVKVPAGHRVALETVGVGEITYECRAKADTAGTYEWVFVGPKAVLNDRSGKQVGTYYGPPATWEAADGSKLTGTQLAVAPAVAGSIPLQLVKANPAMGAGTMMGISHVQRVATKGGVAPAMACGMASVGQRQIVGYQADYIFYKAAT